MSKRFVPSSTLNDDLQQTRKKLKALHNDNPLIETHSSFVSVYRQLKAATPSAAPAAGTADATACSWLADLQAAATPAVEPELSAAPRETSRRVVDWSTAEEFHRPQSLEKDFYEQRSFVRADCKSQLIAAKRKMKQRLFS